MIRSRYTLADFIEETQYTAQVRKREVYRGDWVLVRTCNSVYTIRMLDDHHCLVSGGWFDRHGLSPVVTSITGCSWGGCMIKTDIIAACGLCLEFGNRVITSPIRAIVLFPYWISN